MNTTEDPIFKCDNCQKELKGRWHGEVKHAPKGIRIMWEHRKIFFWTCSKECQLKLDPDGKMQGGFL